MTVAFLHDHTADHDSIEESVAFGDGLANLFLDGVWCLQVVEGDPKRLLRGNLLNSSITGWV
jgi:hypothetical protein